MLEHALHTLTALAELFLLFFQVKQVSVLHWTALHIVVVTTTTEETTTTSAATTEQTTTTTIEETTTSIEPTTTLVTTTPGTLKEDVILSD